VRPWKQFARAEPGVKASFNGNHNAKRKEDAANVMVSI
jgi:hypothetical protein